MMRGQTSRVVVGGSIGAIALVAAGLIFLFSRSMSIVHLSRAVNFGGNLATRSSRVTSQAEDPSPTETRTIDPAAGEYFEVEATAPPSAISPEEAWQVFAKWRQLPNSDIPSAFTYDYGELTLPLHADHTPVWGFEAPIGCIGTRLKNATYPDSCIEWVFLNADSGEFVDEAYAGSDQTSWRDAAGTQLGLPRRTAR